MILQLTVDQLIAFCAASFVLGSGGALFLLIRVTAQGNDRMAGCMSALVAGLSLVLILGCLYVALFSAAV